MIIAPSDFIAIFIQFLSLDDDQLEVPRETGGQDFWKSSTRICEHGKPFENNFKMAAFPVV